MFSITYLCLSKVCLHNKSKILHVNVRDEKNSDFKFKKIKTSILKLGSQDCIGYLENTVYVIYIKCIYLNTMLLF